MPMPEALSARRGVMRSRIAFSPLADDEIDLALRNDVRQPVVYDLPAGRTNNVTDEEYAHECGCRVPRNVNHQEATTKNKKSGLLGRGD